jgi:hypothetical protein
MPEGIGSCLRDAKTKEEKYGTLEQNHVSCCADWINATGYDDAQLVAKGDRPCHKLDSSFLYKRGRKIQHLSTITKKSAQYPECALHTTNIPIAAHYGIGARDKATTIHWSEHKVQCNQGPK